MNTNEVMAQAQVTVKKVYREVEIEAKNSPMGSYAAGCGANYGSDDSCYVCDYGG